MHLQSCIHHSSLPQSKDLYRELIKRAKAWRDHMWPRGSGGTGRPSSYLISLLVARAFENAQKKMGLFSTMSPETLALQWVANINSIDTWMANTTANHGMQIKAVKICMNNVLIRLFALWLCTNYTIAKLLHLAKSKSLYTIMWNYQLFT